MFAEHGFELPGEARRSLFISTGSGGQPGAVTKINLKFKFITMRTLSMLEFRRNARRVLEAVRRGERLVLTYRGEPVARLEPVRPGVTAVPDDDPLLRVDDFAVDGAGGPLTNVEIDRVVYGQ